MSESADYINLCLIILTGLFLLILEINCKSYKLSKESYYYPAEFEKHEAIWLAWPTYENKKGKPSDPVIMDIIRNLKSHVKVELMVQDSAEVNRVKIILNTNNIPNSHVIFRIIPHKDIWIRDMGPIFLKSNKGNLKIAEFNFNMWGYENSNSEKSKVEKRVPGLVAKELGLQTVKTNLISEGGNREVNGKGTMLLVEAVERQRNPSMELITIEKELKRVLGQKKVIWLKNGIAEDQHTCKGVLPGNVFTFITAGGHIDELCRFANDSTVLPTEISENERKNDPIAAISYKNMEENYEILKNATDQDSLPFKIIRVPSAPTLFESMQAGDGVFDYIQKLKYEDGTVINPKDTIKVVMASSYLNYIITNGIVIMQTYWKLGRSEAIKEKDQKVMRIFQDVFPDRKIVGINAEAVNLGGGGLHCISQQQPTRM